MVEDGANSRKIDYFTILNPKGHPIRISGPIVTAVLLNGWIAGIVVSI